MPNGLLVTIGIIVVMSILGYLTQMLKRASDRRMEEREREKQRERRANAALANPNVSSRNDLDRYIQAVEAQRQRPVPTARPAARATPVPTIQPARKKARTEDAATAFPTAKVRGAGAAPVVPDDLPMATVVTPRGSVPTAAPILRAEKAATLTPSRSTRSATPVGRQLVALFGSGEAVALAVVLHEVLGPPKCRQGTAVAGGQWPVASEKTEGGKLTTEAQGHREDRSE
jgi:hypothetical protein